MTTDFSRPLRRILFPLILITVPAFAGTFDSVPAREPLTLANFWTSGWDQAWSLRQSLPDGAPDLPLFHSPTNFLVRVTRTDYYFENNLNKSGTRDARYLDQYIDYAFNQRFMISIFGNYTWVDKIAGRDKNGAGGGAIGRFELVNTQTASTCLNLRVDLPDNGIGVHTTKLSAAIAGWQDLSRLGAGELGLYYDVEDDVYAGLSARGAARDDVAYDIGFARTWTQSKAPIACLTSFIECSGATNLDGTKSGFTEITATPGLQFILGGRNLVMLGVDIPVTHPAPDREVYRISYIYCF